LSFAGITSSDKIDGSADGENPPAKPAVGSLVQWTSNGVDQLAEPARIRGFSDDDEWAFVDGSETGLPVAELNVIEPPAVESGTKNQGNGGAQKLPPSNPFVGSPPPATGTSQETWALEEGKAYMAWPTTLSKDGVLDLEYRVEGVLRALRRKVGLEAKK
jgi:hypothetical protein